MPDVVAGSCSLPAGLEGWVVLKLKAMIEDMTPEELIRAAVRRYRPKLHGGMQHCFTCHRNRPFRWVQRDYPFLNGVTVLGVPTRKCTGCGEETVIVGLMAEVEEAVKRYSSGTKIRFEQLLDGAVEVQADTP